MNNWIKIQSFERVYQAELCKEILERNEVKAVIFNTRDSLFLYGGDVELHVSEQDAPKALALINEFEGISKISSFFMYEPVEQLRKVLEQNGIETILKRKEDSRFLLENFELYVRNENLEQVLPYINGTALNDWTLVETCRRTRQTRFRVELLDENQIKCLIIKKRNSSHQLAEIQIWVEAIKSEIARTILLQLNGWIKLRNFEQQHKAEIIEDLLGRQAIRSIIKQDSDTFYTLYVEGHNEENAILIMNQHAEWRKLRSFLTQVEAAYVKDILSSNQLDSVIVKSVDNNLFLGEISLYVDSLDYNNSLKVLKEIPKFEE